MALIIIGMIFLFLKWDVTLIDTSLFYLGTNLFGLLLLKIGWDESESTEGQKINDQLWFYGVMNLMLLTCRLFDVHVDGISLDYFESYALAYTLLFAHFYVFFYPLYIFSALIRLDRHTLQRPFSYSVNYMVPICVCLALISFLSFTTELVRSLIWTTIILAELHGSIRLLIINKTKFDINFKLGEKMLSIFKKHLN